MVGLQVMLDGIPVHEYNHHWLHKNISIVGQEPTLYARSIRENIIYGLEGEITIDSLSDCFAAGGIIGYPPPPLPLPALRLERDVWSMV